MSFETVESIDNYIAKLEQQKKLIEQRDGQVDKVLAVLNHYAQVLTPAQRQRIAKAIGATSLSDAPPKKRAGTQTAKKTAAKKASRKGRKLGKVAPRYQIPGGATWTGRGRTPTGFAAWSSTAAGKAWHKANPGEKYPGVEGAAKATKKVSKKQGAKKVRKAARKA